MRDISRATGVSLAGLYHYCKSKEELLFLIQDHCFGRVQERLEQRIKKINDPFEKLRTLIDNHLSFFAANMAEMKVLSHEDDVLKNGFGSEIAGIKREYYRICMELLDDFKRAKGLQFSSRIAVLSLFGMMNWIYSWYNPRADANAKELSRQMGDIFLQGICAPRKTKKKRSAITN